MEIRRSKVRARYPYLKEEKNLVDYEFGRYILGNLYSQVEFTKLVHKPYYMIGSGEV